MALAREPRPCRACGRAFTPTRRGKSGAAAKHCSGACARAGAGKTRRVDTAPKVCEYCRATFSRGRRAPVSWATARFCSLKCRALAESPKHGLSYMPEYRAWQMMRLRCTEPTNAAYPDYGGRGIRVCERWQNSPENFVADMGPKPSPKHELDRIDNNAGYSPENCRWATRKQNCRNRRTNAHLTVNGETRTLAEWCEVYGVRGDTVMWRIKRLGWSPEAALTTPRYKTPTDAIVRPNFGAA